MKNDLSLYGGVSELHQIESILENDFDSTSPDQLEELSKRMSELTNFLTKKVDNVCYYDQSIDDFIAAIDDRVVELSALKANVKKKQAKFHQYILSCLDALGTKKVTGKLYSITYRAPTKVVEILDENKLDPEFLRTKIPPPITEVDKVAIKEALVSGKEVSGATLKDGKRSLSFRAGK